MANLYNIKCEKSWVELINFYDENSGVVKIPMDMQLTAVENAQAYYKKYNKEKSAEIATLHQKEDNLDEISYLESQLVNLRNCTEDNEINEIRNELSLLGYIKIKKKSGQQKQKLSRPMHYLSSDGFDIYAGKNNVQNDYLTTKFAEPSDIWLHTKKIPGSHVIIKSNKGKVSEAAINDAAAIAAYYSKARESSNVPVDYTERKNVKKPSGSKPGMVVYYTNKTFYVTPGKLYKYSEKNRMKDNYPSFYFYTGYPITGNSTHLYSCLICIFVCHVHFAFFQNNLIKFLNKYIIKPVNFFNIYIDYFFTGSGDVFSYIVCSYWKLSMSPVN
jgi:predicted ribosome quality control (RQC) complex YloA/Tae2 family protein